MIHNHCVACGTVGNLNQHHLIPRSLGGSDDESNLLTLCGSCHAKAHQVKADWRSSELTKKALQAKKDRGERTGHIPYGKRLSADGVHLEDCQDEQSILSEIQRLRQSGMSFNKVASNLNQRSILKRDKSRWNAVNLHCICKRLPDFVIGRGNLRQYKINPIDFSMFLEGRKVKPHKAQPEQRP